MNPLKELWKVQKIICSKQYKIERKSVPPSPRGGIQPDSFFAAVQDPAFDVENRVHIPLNQFN